MLYPSLIQLSHVHGPIAHVVLQSGPKSKWRNISFWDYEPSSVPVFLSVVNCGRICRAQIYAHSGIEPSRLAKKLEKISLNFWPADSSQILHAGPPPAIGKKGEWNVRYNRSQWGIFAFWRFLSNISATRGWIHLKFYLCRDNVCRRAPPPSAVHRPRGAGGGGVKNSKNGEWSHSCSGQIGHHFCFSRRFQMWFNMSGRDLRTFRHWAIHVGQRVSTGWAKSSKKL